MQSVGQKLRQAREAQGRTLEDIHSATRISLRTLEAIEADDLDAISSAFLYKSFVRQIAGDVGLNYASLEPAVKAAVATIPVPLVPGEGGAPLPNVPALRVGRKRSPRLVYAISSFAPSSGCLFRLLCPLADLQAECIPGFSLSGTVVRSCNPSFV